MFLVHLKPHEIELLVGFFWEMLLLSRMLERDHTQTLRYLF